MQPDRPAVPAGPVVPIVIGVLGGIASGKSTVARVLAAQGAALLDADLLAQEALRDPTVVAALILRHGADIVSGGAIDRTALARRTFGHPEELSHLESLIHPRVRSELERRLREHLERRDVAAVVLDVPLLLESSPLASRCDLLLFVESSPAERRRRGETLRGWNADELARREAHQLSVDEKRRRADVVLVNDGTSKELSDRVLAWLTAAGGFAGLPRHVPFEVLRDNERPDSASGER